MTNTLTLPDTGRPGSFETPETQLHVSYTPTTAQKLAALAEAEARVKELREELQADFAALKAALPRQRKPREVKPKRGRPRGISVKPDGSVGIGGSDWSKKASEPATEA